MINNLFFIFVFIFMISSILRICLSNNLIIITVLNGVFSIACVLFYVFNNAPDVALTETSVGVGLYTALAVMTIFITLPNHNKHSNLNLNNKKLQYTIIGCSVLCLITIAVALYEAPSFGSIHNPTINNVYHYYIFESRRYHIPNVVTSILGSFRGFDTLGETFVIFTATIAVLALLKPKKSKDV